MFAAAANPGTSDRSAFAAYVAQGGFPFQDALRFEKGPSIKYVEDVLSAILLKDVVKWSNIRDVDLLERLAHHVAVEEGRLLSMKSISDHLKSEHRKAAPDTVANCMNAMEKAFLLHKVPREDVIGKQRLAFNAKWYVSDQGLRQAMGVSNQANIGQALEDIVFMELKCRGYSVSVGKVADLEVDFVARRGDEAEYYQVAYLMADDAARERAFALLLAVPDNYPKFVLSMDELDFSKEGIRAVNLVDWLLRE